MSTRIDTHVEEKHIFHRSILDDGSEVIGFCRRDLREAAQDMLDSIAQYKAAGHWPSVRPDAPTEAKEVTPKTKKRGRS